MLFDPLILADTLASWTEALAIATFVLAGTTVASLIVAWKLAANDRAAAAKLLEDQKTNDDARSAKEIEAATEVAERQIAAARADADRQIEATKVDADRQIAEMRAQLDAATRPLLIEVQPTGPAHPEMGARPNPNIRPANSRHIEQTIRVQFGAAEVELDPRAPHVEFVGGMARISVAVRNVGNGLAQIHPSAIDFAGEQLGEITFRDVQRQRVPVGETARVSLIVRYPVGMRLPVLGASDPAPWVLSVPYTDFAGRQPVRAAIHLTRDADALDAHWLISAVQQHPFEEFFAGETETGRTLRLYYQHGPPVMMLDVEGVPFEPARDTSYFGSLDGQALTIERLQYRLGVAAIVLTPTSVIAASTPGTDFGTVRSAFVDLAQARPAGGWRIEPIGEDPHEGGRVFRLRIGNGTVSADVAIELTDDIAAHWQSRRPTAPLEQIVLDQAAAMFRSADWSRIQHASAHPTVIIAGMMPD